MNGQTLTIRKSFFGYLVGIFYASVVLALLGTVGYLAYLSGVFWGPTAALLLLASLLVLASLTVYLYVYHESYLRLDDTGLTAANWDGLFADQSSVIEWNRIQSVDVLQRGFFPNLLGFGTLLVQSAGTHQNVALPMTPNVVHWRDEIERRASTAPILTHNV